MGLCQSEEEKKQTKTNEEIDRTIRQAQSANDKVVKLLLLGAGECGKSTLMKQMRILNNKGFTDEELMQQSSVVYSNTLQAMNDLIENMRLYKIGFQESKREEDANLVKNTIKAGEESEPISEELFLALKRLWADPAINQKTYSRRLEFHLHDSAKQ